MLSQPIPLCLYDDPIAAYAQIAATIPAGRKYVQNFDYTTIEVPQATELNYLEGLYVGSPITAADGDLGSWEISQGALGACGTFASICAYASIPPEHPYALEKGIYPLTQSKIGLYFVRIANPDNPLETKWMAIDSRMPCKPYERSCFVDIKLKEPLAPALLLKAAATARGGCFDEITNSSKLGMSFSWFPNVTLNVSEFEQFQSSIQKAGICLTSMKQQYDATGAPITPAGVVYAHAFALVDAVSVLNHDGTTAKIVRVENPWGSGTDFISEYSEGAPFWDYHPELADKLAEAKQSLGNYWVSWNQVKALSGKTEFEVAVPIPSTELPYAATFRHTVDGSIVITKDWTLCLSEIQAQTPIEQVKVLTLSEAATVVFDIRWLSGSGARHTTLHFCDMTGKRIATFPTEVWWANRGTQSVALPAGEYRVYISTRSLNTDRGVLQVIAASDKNFTLK